MAHRLLTDLEGEVRRAIQDEDGTQWGDQELVDLMNDAFRFVLHEVYRQGKYASIWEQNAKKVFLNEEFSYQDEIDLPTDFFRNLHLKVVGLTQPIHVVGLQEIDEVTKETRALLYGVRVGAPVPGGSNAGTDELDTRGDYSHTANQAMTVTIASGTTFNWTGVGSGNGVTIDGEWQTLENGVQIRFASTSGYTAADTWSFTAYADQMVQRMQLNFNPTTDIELWYLRDVEHFVLASDVIDTTKYVPLNRYYDATKLFMELKALNRNEENIGQDLSLFAPVIELITNIAADIAEDDQAKIEPYYKSLDML